MQPYFSSKHFEGDLEKLLIEKYELLLKSKKVAYVINYYFQSITDALIYFKDLWDQRIKSMTVLIELKTALVSISELRISNRI